jgi:hypothetical protein
MGLALSGRGESGFGLVDALVGLSVLAFGMLGIAGAFAYGARSLAGSNDDILAREKAVEAIESVFAARDTKTIAWAQIKNVQGETGSDGGVFLDGDQPLALAGPDGLLNTEDDDSQIETLVQPGPDGLLGTADDRRRALTDFTRLIEVTQVNPTLRRVRVVIRYTIGLGKREYEVITYISSYS